MGMDAIEQRRERAREAARCAWEGTVSPRSAVEAAIEAATQVRISTDAIDAAIVALDGTSVVIFSVEMTAALAAALGALGFEVIEP